MYTLHAHIKIMSQQHHTETILYDRELTLQQLLIFF